MSRWCRLWADMPTDPKFRVIAKRANRPVSEVLAVFLHMLANATERGERASERGELAGWDDEAIGIAIDAETEHVEAIRLAMQGRLLDGDRLTGWDKRQPVREDGSAERAKAWREERKAKKAQDEIGKTHSNARERDRTQENSRGEEIRIEQTSSAGDDPRARAAAAAEPDDVESQCRKLVGQEPVAVDPNFEPILRLLDDAEITEADVITGIQVGLSKADPQYRFRHWRNFDGWIRGAAKDRLGTGKRAPTRELPPKPPPDPSDPLIDMRTGFKRNVSDLRLAVQKFKENKRTWNFGELGPEPDQPGCRVPEHVLVEAGFRSAAAVSSKRAFETAA